MAKPKKTELQRYCDLLERKRALDRESRALEKEIDLLTDSFLTYLETLGKDAAKVHGFQLVVSEGNAYVAWAKEFLKLAGAEKVAELSENAVRPPKLTVTPLGS